MRFVYRTQGGGWAKKTLVLVLCLLFTFSAIPNYSAGFFVPVGDILNTPAHSLNSQANVTVQLKESIVDTLAWMFAKQLIRMAGAQFIDWINSGFEGNPVFIDDPANFFLSAADNAVGEFIFNDPDLNFLCDPLSIGFDIRLGLRLTYGGNFRERVQCRLSDVLFNVQNAQFFTCVSAGVTATQLICPTGYTLQAVCLTSGGSIASTSNDPNYSCPAGTTLTHRCRSGSGAIAMPRVSGQSGSGAQSCVSVTPGTGQANVRGGLTSFTRGNFGAGGIPAFLAISRNPKNNPYGQYAIASAEASARVAGSVKIKEKIGDWNNGFLGKLSKEGKIKTPGSVIKDNLSATLGSSQRSLEIADELSEVVDGAIGALLNQAMLQGITGLSGGGSSSYTNLLRNTDPTEAVNQSYSAEQIQAISDANTSQYSGLPYSYQSLYDSEVARSQTNYTTTQCSVQRDSGLVSLTNAVATQSYTQPSEGTYTPYGFGAANAFDNSNYSYSSTYGGTTHWWQVSLPNVENVSAIQIDLESSDSALLSGNIVLMNTTNNRQDTVPNPTTGEANTYVIPVDSILGGNSGDSGYYAIPTDLQGFETKYIRIESLKWIRIREIKVFRHVRPTIEACNVPISITTTAEALFDPFNTQSAGTADDYIKAYEYPTPDTPQLIVLRAGSSGSTLDDAAVNAKATVKNQSGALIAPNSFGVYSLPAGSYTIEYQVKDSLGVKSLIVQRSLTVVGSINTGNPPPSGTCQYGGTYPNCNSDPNAGATSNTATKFHIVANVNSPANTSNEFSGYLGSGTSGSRFMGPCISSYCEQDIVTPDPTSPYLVTFGARAIPLYAASFSGDCRSSTNTCTVDLRRLTKPLNGDRIDVNITVNYTSAGTSF